MTNPFFRARMLVFFLCSLALAGVSAAPGWTQEQNASRSAAGQAAAPPQTATESPKPAFDPTARIKSLHDRLRITPEQEPLWDTIAQTIHDNTRNIVPLLRERLRSTTNGSALDVLHAYEALGEHRLDSLNKFIAGFDPLYASLSESQKKIADAILREGPLNAMVGGLPEFPVPLGYPLAYPLFVPYRSRLGGPLFVHRAPGFQHFGHTDHLGHLGHFGPLGGLHR
jgi:LTXXQ motif family protein